MSERKVINKYYPPDFDPLKIKPVRNKKNKDALQTVRLMTPFSIRCKPCGEYISKSKKFNARKQDTNEKYLQQKIFRFHIRCPRCNLEIVFRTDPLTSDFVMESGGERNYNPVKKDQTKMESYEEILQRLEEKDEKEKQELLNKDKLNKISKIQLLESKLIEQEEQDKLNENLLKMIQKQDGQDSVKINLKDDEFDKLAKEEFAILKQKYLNDMKVIPKENSIEKVLVKSIPKSTVDNGDSNTGKDKKHRLVIDYDSSSDEDSVIVPKKVKVSKLGLSRV